MDSNTERNAAVPVAPAFGGKLNTTAAIFLFARSARFKSINLPTREANMSARSMQTCMSCSFSDAGNTQRRLHPVH